MTRSALDHLVVAAPDLESGARYVRDTLGVEPQMGGAHARMGTHNLLLKLGDKLYLEIIAIDPTAPSPGRPRWFDLDRLTPPALPGLISWVVRTDDIAALTAATGGVLGVVEPMQRGALEWLISITPDGTRPLSGIGPALIQWHGERHPAGAMRDSGVSLRGLVVRIPAPGEGRRILDQIDPSGPVRFEQVHEGQATQLQAQFDTPGGLKVMIWPSSPSP